MKLYSNAVAPNPRRVRMFLAEKGGGTIPEGIELVEIDLVKRENEGEAFRALNPLGLVPVLELDDGRRLAESIAICRYLEDLYPTPPLLGTESWQRATIEQWNRHMELELLRPVSDTFRHTHPYWKDRIEQAPAWGEISRRKALESFAWLDSVLAEREWIAGDEMSVADITALVAVDFGRVVQIRIGDEQAHLRRWREAMAARPSAAA